MHSYSVPGHVSQTGKEEVMASPSDVIQHHSDLQYGMNHPEGLTAEYINSLPIFIGEVYAHEGEDDPEVAVRAFFAPYRPDKSSLEAEKFSQEIGHNLIGAKSYLITREMVE